ncbi:MAG: hypothetical protein GKR89_13775 [Candidatus Latescibacteria bacterium]|nr:hypothetical protein [Candidatus Latescibacterota bacterium]
MPPLPNGGDPANDDFSSGPQIGQSVPHFTLSDQKGQPVAYRPDGQHRSLILFHRSADW